MNTLTDQLVVGKRVTIAVPIQAVLVKNQLRVFGREFHVEAITVGTI